MKKLFSHPLFYCVFALLGLAGMLLQFWFFGLTPDSRGLMPRWHISGILTTLVLALTLVLVFLSRRHIRFPKHPVMVRAVGAVLAALFTGISAWVMLDHQHYLTAILAALAALGSLYVVWARFRSQRVFYGVYAVFALCYMFYLISRYRDWSAEPETLHYAYQLLALVCMMLVFYQKAALQAHTGRFSSYHLWHSLATVLSLTAVPSASNPMLYLAGAIWLILDPSPRPLRREKYAESDAP